GLRLDCVQERRLVRAVAGDYESRAHCLSRHHKVDEAAIFRDHAPIEDDEMVRVLGFPRDPAVLRDVHDFGETLWADGPELLPTTQVGEDHEVRLADH